MSKHGDDVLRAADAVERRPDGGQAFPHLLYGDGGVPIAYDTGLSIRDYFAAQGLGAIIGATVGWPADRDAGELSRRAYMLADAMLAERAK